MWGQGTLPSTSLCCGLRRRLCPGWRPSVAARSGSGCNIACGRECAVEMHGVPASRTPVCETSWGCGVREGAPVRAHSSALPLPRTPAEATNGVGVSSDNLGQRTRPGDSSYPRRPPRPLPRPRHPPYHPPPPPPRRLLPPRPPPRRRTASAPNDGRPPSSSFPEPSSSPRSPPRPPLRPFARATSLSFCMRSICFSENTPMRVARVAPSLLPMPLMANCFCRSTWKVKTPAAWSRISDAGFM